MKIDLSELFGVPSEFDEKSVNALLKAINQSQLKDFDYLKFKVSVQNLISIEPEESVRIKTTFTTAQTLGVSKEYLLTTARHYQTVLNREKEKFTNALQNKMNQDIEGKKEEAVKIDEEIAHKKRQIEQLNRDIEALEKRASMIDSEVETARTRIQDTRDRFVEAIGHFENAIAADMEKIERIL